VVAVDDPEVVLRVGADRVRKREQAGAQVESTWPSRSNTMIGWSVERLKQ